MSIYEDTLPPWGGSLGSGLMLKPASSSDSFLDANAIAYWSCNESSGAGMTDIIGGYDLALYSGAGTRIQGVSGNGISAGNIWRKASIDEALRSALTAGEYTIDMWVKCSPALVTSAFLFSVGTNTSNHFSLQEQDIFIFYINPNNKIGVANNKPAATNNSWDEYEFGDFPTSGWHHFAIVKTNTGVGTGNYRVYVDGVQSGVDQATTTYTDPLSGQSACIQAYAYPTNGSTPPDSSWGLDEIRISNIARTEAEIIAAYNRIAVPAPSFAAGLEGPSLDSGISFASQTGTGSGGTGFGVGSYSFATNAGKSGIKFEPPVGNNGSGTGPRTRFYLSSAISLATTWSVGLWLYNPTAMTPVESGDNANFLFTYGTFGTTIGMFVYAGSNQIGWWDGSNIRALSSVTLGSGWEHFMTVFDGASIGLYHKGNLVGSYKGSPVATEINILGSGNDGYAPVYPNYMRNFQYFDSALNASQINYIATH